MIETNASQRTRASRNVQATCGLINYRLEQAVGGSGVAAVDVIIVEIMDADGATGLGFSYVLGGHGSVAYRATQDLLARFVDGQALPPPPALWRKIAASFNRTGSGPNLVALAAIDVAAWDLTARRQEMPLYEALGGESRAVPVYGSGGYTATQSPARAVEVALEHVGRGLTSVKPRVAGTRADAALFGALRAALPDSIQLMADANEKCDLPAALALMGMVREHGVLFVEEPLPASAIAGYRALAAQSTIAIATGEHLQERSSFMPFIAEHIAAVIQPDLAMVGGLTPSREIAALAEAFNAIVSPHFLPGLFVHLAGAAPALKWLEEFPLLEPLFDGWVAVDAHGMLSPSEAPGHGLSLHEEFRRKMVR